MSKRSWVLFSASKTKKKIKKLYKSTQYLLDKHEDLSLDSQYPTKRWEYYSTGIISSLGCGWGWRWAETGRSPGYWLVSLAEAMSSRLTENSYLKIRESYGRHPTRTSGLQKSMHAPTHMCIHQNMNSSHTNIKRNFLEYFTHISFERCE